MHDLGEKLFDLRITQCFNATGIAVQIFGRDGNSSQVELVGMWDMCLASRFHIRRI
jgi:hypothetical protein